MVNLFYKGYKYVLFEAAGKEGVTYTSKRPYSKRIYDYVLNGKLFKAPVFPKSKSPTIPIVLCDLERAINLEYSNKMKPKF